MKRLKKQDQLIVPPETNSVSCPCCSTVCTIKPVEPKAKASWYYIAEGCSHANSVVHAGGYSIAIHFIWS